MIKITIADTATGETHTLEGAFLVAHLLDNDGDIANIVAGRSSPLGLAKLFAGHDQVRDTVFKDYPKAQTAYTMRDLLFRTDTVVDLTELLRQAREAGNG